MNRPTNKWPAVAIGSVLVLAFGLVLATRVSDIPIREPDAPAALVRELRFEDRPDGSVAVIDARLNQQIDSISGEAGFARGTLRGFARDRKARGLGPEKPFQLIGRQDGRLTLFDPETGRIVDLESFGPTNAAVFAQLLNK